MLVVKKVCRSIIQSCLAEQGNHKDNQEALNKFKFYYLVKLGKNDFLNLCFLDNDEVKDITKNGRRLENVAKTSMKLLENNDGILSSNWDLKKTIKTTIYTLKVSNLPSFLPLIIRDAKNGEQNHGSNYYIQDGNHRCLGYAIFLLRNPDKGFIEQESYLATNYDLFNRID
ncbi:hypothetical protein KKH43_02020 [Patescibacteria group bacterium]|nr:hypothetical protein [Patescibacteria group bacterium]